MIIEIEGKKINIDRKEKNKNKNKINLKNQEKK